MYLLKSRDLHFSQDVVAPLFSKRNTVWLIMHVKKMCPDVNESSTAVCVWVQESNYIFFWTSQCHFKLFSSIEADFCNDTWKNQSSLLFGFQGIPKVYIDTPYECDVQQSVQESVQIIKSCSIFHIFWSEHAQNDQGWYTNMIRALSVWPSDLRIVLRGEAQFLTIDKHLIFMWFW